MKIAIASLLVGAAAAASIKSDSKAGRRMLSKARRLDGNGEIGNWAVGYSLKFEKCFTSDGSYGYFGGEDNNNNDGGNGNGYYQYQQKLVHFKLCPTGTCGSGCTGGDYVLDMNEFLMSYIEYKQEAMEQQCEMVKENCYCENANDDEACEAQCYMSAGIYENCVEQENDGDGQEFELQQAIECGQLDVDEEAAQYYAYQNGDGNYYNGQNGGQDVEYFVGPYCSADGSSINLGVFMDESCSYDAPEGLYEQFNYGQALPYSSESLVSSECISCMQVDNDNNNNQNNNGDNNGDNQNNNNNNNNNNEDVEVLEMCERMYEDAGKCESDIDAYGFYPNTYACDFIEGASGSGAAGGVGSRISSAVARVANVSATPKVLAGVFAATTVAFAGVAFYFHRKLQRRNVNLVSGHGTMA